MLPLWLGAADAIRPIEAARLHRAVRRRGGGVAARGPCAAGRADAAIGGVEIPQRGEPLTDPCQSVMLRTLARSTACNSLGKAARVHIAARRCGGVAACCARAAAGQIADCSITCADAGGLDYRTPLVDFRLKQHSEPFRCRAFDDDAEWLEPGPHRGFG
jgi:hypothetical protein